MKSGFTGFIIIISTVFLFLFEMWEMFPTMDSTTVGWGYKTVILAVLFLLFFLLCIHGRRMIVRNSVLTSFVAVILGIYISALLCGGITSAFQTKSQYFSVILPVLILRGINGQSSSRYDFIIKCVCVLFVALTVYYFFNYSFHIFEELEAQNNGAYTLLYFLPFLLCLKKNYLRIAGMVVILAALLFSLKRGGLVAFAIAIMAYWLVYSFSFNKKKAGLGVFLLSVFVIVAFVYFYMYFDEMTGNLLSTRFQNLQDDGGSGRLDTYPVVWSHIKSSSFLNLVFGHGWNAVKLECGLDRSAHNDFLEILYDFGIIVFAIYLLFYVRFFKLVRSLIKLRSFYAAPLCATLVLMLTNSMVSHIVYYPKYAVLIALFLGLISVPVFEDIKQVQIRK